MGSWRRAAAGGALALVTLGAAACRAGAGSDGRDRVDPGVGPTSTLSAQTGDPEGTGSPSAIPTAAVGESVTGAGYELVVHQVTSPAQAPDPEAAPPTGYVLVAVDVELVNRTASVRDTTYLRLELVDGAGTHYRATELGDRPPSGWVPPGQPHRGVHMFEVPALATDLALVLRPDLVSGIAAAIRLG